WLSAAPRAGPRCLVLVQDGYDLAGLRFYQGKTSEPYTGPAADPSTPRMARLLAALGWTVLAPVDGPAAPAVPGNRRALEELVEASGGETVTDLDQLGAALERLSHRQEVILRLTGPPDGEPLPLEIRGRDSAAPIRAARWSSVATPPEVSLARGRRILEEPSGEAGRLAVRGALRAEGQQRGGRLALEVLADLRGSGLGRSDLLFRVSWLVEPLEGRTVSAHHLVAVGDLSDADAWLYRASVDLPEEAAEAAVVVEELRSSTWGAAIAEISSESIDIPDLRIMDLGSAVPAAPTPAFRNSSTATVILLLPPRKRPASGKVRFRTLISHPAIAKVDFYLDGRKLGTDASPPFGWVVELDSPPRPQTVEVVAYSTDDLELGGHSLTVNRVDRSFEIRIARIAGDPEEGSVEVEAAVSVPVGARLAGIEVYRNEVLAARLAAPPWRVRIETPDPSPQDFIRMVAYLEDGSSIEDARLLASQAVEERLEVNLVELNVVVLDREDRALTGLTRQDFTVLLDGRRREIERFALAEEVPLVLGLVIDTSQSMDSLMPDTKKAGAQFLGETLRDGDLAFLVDFDTKPRLAQAATPDFVQLLRRFSALRADGFTALYDAIIFSLLQFEEAAGRKALVLLTDGDDYRSRFGPKRCIQYGRQLGVPVYIISLAAVRIARPWSPSGPAKAPARPLEKPWLEGLTDATGGRVFYISDMAQLSEAYARINEELRSQYVLAFSTERQLSQQELTRLRVQVPGKGLKVRTVVGGQRVD
ncbi:MAG: VWA domain-containing protein, partial [Thermoanaerobaculia bacterium]